MPATTASTELDRMTLSEDAGAGAGRAVFVAVGGATVGDAVAAGAAGAAAIGAGATGLA